MKTLLFSTIMLMSAICFAQTIVCKTQLDSGGRFREYDIRNDTTIAVTYTVQVSKADSVKAFPRRFTLKPNESQILSVRRYINTYGIIKFELILKH